MTITISRMVTLISLFLLVGCVAYSGTEFKAETKSEAGRARLYVYRHVAYVGIANADVTFLHLDGQRIGRIRMGGFLSVPISPGQHSLKTTESLWVATPEDFSEKPALAQRPDPTCISDIQKVSRLSFRS